MDFKISKVAFGLVLALLLPAASASAASRGAAPSRAPMTHPSASAAATPAAAPLLPQVQTFEGIKFLNGGVSSGERAALRSTFPLKLVFAGRGRELVNDVKVVIFKGGKKIFETTATNGPWLFVDLPSGRYVVRATYGGIAKSERVTIAGPSQRKTVYFGWGRGGSASGGRSSSGTSGRSMKPSR